MLPAPQLATISLTYARFAFQISAIVAPNGSAADDFGGTGVLGRVGDWRDTLDTPVGGTSLQPPACTITRTLTLSLILSGAFRMRFTPRDFRGVLPFHCHEAQHADYGMMANVEIV